MLRPSLKLYALFSAYWVEAKAGKPDFILPTNSSLPSGGATTQIASIAVSPKGDVFVLLLEAVPNATTGEVTTPLFVIVSGGTTWEAQNCVDLPTTALADGSPQPFGRLVFDPIQPDTFYAIHGAQVYRVHQISAGNWAWIPVAPGLPGCWVSDLWIGNVAAPGSPPKVVLRAGVIGRGVWETDVTAEAVTPSVDLYVRRHALDLGWLTHLRDGLPDPYHPSLKVWHYQCADAKIEAPQVTPNELTFFQTDPEASGVVFSGPSTPAGPITNVQFDQLHDDSQLLPKGSTAVRLHVQVQNRSIKPTSGVSVWALCVPAASGVPALDTTSGESFPFWSQFQPDGQIVPALPSTSRWKAVGAPVVLDNIDASHPKIASWLWPVPSLAGQPWHQSLAIFVHSSASPIGESTNVDLDDITLHNKQVGQKNFHIVEFRHHGFFVPDIYFEFHNPTPDPRVCSLVVDLRAVPADVEVALRFAQLATVRPLPASIPGILRREAPGFLWLVGWLLGWPLRAVWRMLPDLFLGLKNLPRLPVFEHTRYIAQTGAVVRVEDVVLPGRGFAAARLSLSAPRFTAAGAEFRVEIQQLVQGRVAGGSTFLFRGPQPTQPIVYNQPRSAEFADQERAASEGLSRYLPPWIRRLRAAASPPARFAVTGGEGGMPGGGRK